MSSLAGAPPFSVNPYSSETCGRDSSPICLYPFSVSLFPFVSISQVASLVLLLVKMRNSLAIGMSCYVLCVLGMLHWFLVIQVRFILWWTRTTPSPLPFPLHRAVLRRIYRPIMSLHTDVSRNDQTPNSSPQAFCSKRQKPAVLWSWPRTCYL